jgi:hypothetical protein
VQLSSHRGESYGSHTFTSEFDPLQGRVNNTNLQTLFDDKAPLAHVREYEALKGQTSNSPSLFSLPSQCLADTPSTTVRSFPGQANTNLSRTLPLLLHNTNPTILLEPNCPLYPPSKIDRFLPQNTNNTPRIVLPVQVDIQTVNSTNCERREGIAETNSSNSTMSP